VSVADEMLAANAASIASFQSGQPPEPSRRVAVLTCMDARIDVYSVLGLGAGEAHVLRNAGGVVTDDVVRSLAVSQRRLGTREVVLVHHSGCGMSGFTDEEFAAELAADAGSPPPWSARTFRDAESDVRNGLALLRTSPWLVHREAIRGFVLDIDGGALLEVR
jgi:carbonic anhydrase